MRKITKESISAFLNARSFKKSNMEVEVKPNVTILKLYGNEIAYLYNDPNRTLSITNCGWETNTTKERLNGLPTVRINVKKGSWFLNDNEWNGKLKDIHLAKAQTEYLENMKKSGKAIENFERYMELKEMSLDEFMEEIY